MATMTSINHNATGMAEQQVLSWLHDEESLVTSQRIQHHCVFAMDDGESDETERPISRREGSELLRKLYERDPSGYVATVCTVDRFRSVPVAAASTPNRETETEPIPSNAEEYQTTEFELVTTTDSLPRNGNSSGNDKNSNKDSNRNNPKAHTIVALRSRKATLAESLDAAHERDEAFLRDKLFVEGRADWFDNTACLSHIHATTNKTADDRGAGVPIRSGGAGAGWASASAASEPSTRATTSGVEKRSGSVTAAKASAATAVQSKSKPTTAGSFFAAKTKPGAVANASKTKPKQTSSSAKVTKSNSSKATAKAIAKATPKRDGDDDDDVEMEDAPLDANANSNAGTNIGNADDFVGDEDEDSDDEQDMAERRIRSAELVRKLRERDDHLDALAREDDRDREREAARVTRGAMDAFCEKRGEPANPGAAAGGTAGAEEGARRPRRRRKVFRDTTAVNARGFLVTTTEAVWEEIESDGGEEETDTAGPSSAGKQSQPSKRALAKPKSKQKQKPPAAKKTKPAAKRDLKQGSLMGFFSKKK